MSRMLTISTEVKMRTEECCNCGVLFAITEETYKRLRKSQEWFYCPNGHSQHYVGKTEVQKLREQLEAARETARSHAERADRAHRRAEEADRSRAAYKGQVTKLKNRAKAGVCPCCNRTFQNLARHMASKHPDFTGDDS